MTAAYASRGRFNPLSPRRTRDIVPAVMVAYGGAFQSALAPKDERYVLSSVRHSSVTGFQSALAPKDERYSACRTIRPWASEFQSALAPKDERYGRCTASCPVRVCFNPLSPRRTRDTWRPLGRFNLGQLVSIRSRPEGREILDWVCSRVTVLSFQSALAPKDERYASVTVESLALRGFQSALAPKDERYSVD